MSIIFDVSLNPTFIRMIAPIIVALMEEDERGERGESEQTIKRRKRRLRFVHICLDSKRTMCVVLLFFTKTRNMRVLSSNDNLTKSCDIKHLFFF